MKFAFLLLIQSFLMITERKGNKDILTPHLKIRSQENILSTVVSQKVRWLSIKEGLTGEKIEALYMYYSFGSLPRGW